MAAEISPSTKLCKNILIGVTGSVARVKLSRLVEELLLLQPKVHLVSYKDNLYSNLLYGPLSQGLGTTKFTNLIG